MLTEDELEDFYILCNGKRIRLGEIVQQPEKATEKIEAVIRENLDSEKAAAKKLETVVLKEQTCYEDKELLLQALEKEGSLRYGVTIPLLKYTYCKKRGQEATFEVLKSVNTSGIANIAAYVFYMARDENEFRKRLERKAVSSHSFNAYMLEQAANSLPNAEYDLCILDNLLDALEKCVLIKLNDAGLVGECSQTEHLMIKKPRAVLYADNSVYDFVIETVPQKPLVLHYWTFSRKKLEALLKRQEYKPKFTQSAEEKVYGTLPDDIWTTRNKKEIV